MNASFFVPVFSGSFNTQTQLLCNARDLHKALQVGRKFATWITERIKEYGFIENQDYILISQNGEIKTGRGGDRRSKDYHLTLNMAKEMAMVEKTEIGRQVRRYFIRCEEERYGSMHQVAINHLISKEQADNIQLAVEQRSQRTGESYQKIYAGLHAYLRIDSYKTMLVEHYTAALKYLESVPDAPELFKPAVTDGQVLPNINKDGRWLVIVKNSIATHVENINGYNCINVDVFKKLRMQTKQQAEYLLELAKRMRVIDGECSNSRLDVPIEELHPKFII
ncbi:antA/AntB antirepressor family protein [Snodgrassella communis]|uniref:antA/AntB antirepressor family protein n=1 Tax=Snodgrassella communis TaxID=2946699 RepID=UPI001EF71AED|nr:antA/AntB antirepressor family protein [Snodgrassella communis]